MKKTISIALVIAMLMMLMSNVVIATESETETPATMVITANSVMVKPGERATITLTMEQNPGFSYLAITPIVSAGVVWTAANGDLTCKEWDEVWEEYVDQPIGFEKGDCCK